jgi:hypothetical protein
VLPFDLRRFYPVNLTASGETRTPHLLAERGRWTLALASCPPGVLRAFLNHTGLAPFG